MEIVGPTAGRQLQKQAALATLWSLLGMLIYLWIRFELIYGAAAVVAVFHDTLITVGAFSLMNMEISLTVIAAILTLIGYSMNDTIVVFDRIRENLALSRRETLADVVNRSINQTLSRTVLTSGLTFLTVLSLLVFGGPVLRGFSFALTVGVLIGTYSSIAVAAPMLVAYAGLARSAKGKARAALPAKAGEGVEGEGSRDEVQGSSGLRGTRLGSRLIPGTWPLKDDVKTVEHPAGLIRELHRAGGERQLLQSRDARRLQPASAIRHWIRGRSRTNLLYSRRLRRPHPSAILLAMETAARRICDESP